MYILGVLLQLWLLGSVVTVLCIIISDAVARDGPSDGSKPFTPALLIGGTLRKLK